MAGQNLKQDVSLVFGVLGGGKLSGESGSLIKKQLDDVVNGLNSRQNIDARKIILSLDVTNTKSQLKDQLENKVLKNFGSKTFKITLSKIDASSAIKNVKNQLKDALNALSIKNGVSIEELIKFTGFEGNTKGVVAITSGLEDAANQAAKAVANVKSLKAVVKTVDASYNSAISGKGAIKSQDDLNDIMIEYKRLMEAVANVTADPTKYSSKQVANLEQELLFLRQIIEFLQQEQAEQNKIVKNTQDQVQADKDQTDQAKSRVMALKELMKAVNTVYKSAFTGSNPIEDVTKRQGIMDQYKEWIDNINEFISGSKQLSDADYDSLSKQGTAILDNIRLIQQEQSERKKAAAETERQEKAQGKLNEKLSAFVSQQKKNQLIGRIDSYISRNPRIQSSPLYGDLTNVRDTLVNDAKLSNAEFDDLKVKVDRITASLKEAGLEGNSLVGAITAAYKKFGGWMLVTRSFSLLLRQLKNMVSTVREIDTAMTELRKVTDETETTYSRFLNNAVVRSKQIGATVSDTVTATANFARLGYSIEEASAMADTAIVYKNVGDGIEDINEASESIISTLKAFNVEASNAMSIADKFNAVGNSFAISAKGIGDAMLRSASALKAAGNDIDESIALITAANNVVQDPEKVGGLLRPAA